MYTIRYNRQTNHIAGIAAKCTSTGEEKGGVVAAYAENSCGVLTRGNLGIGKSYATIQEAYDAASRHTRRICKTCAKAALALIAAEQEAADTTEVQIEEVEIVEGAEHQVGDELYFIPSDKRTYPAAIPAGKVVVKRVVDHVQATAYSPRFTYVVQVENVPAATQGTDATELYAPGSVPRDYRFWETYTGVPCADCRKDVSYANSKIVSEPIVRSGAIFPGMPTRAERRVCVKH